MEASIVQLEFPWYAESQRWLPDHEDGDGTGSLITTVHRPTEDAAIRHIRIQARIIQRQGSGLKLNWAQRMCLRLERVSMSKTPYPEDICQWIAERTTFRYRQINALLDEASQVIALRELLGLPPVDLNNDDVAIWKVAA